MGTSSKKNLKRSISPAAKPDPSSKSDSKLPAIDHDDLPARLNKAINVADGEEGIGEFEDAWEDEFEAEDGEDGNSVHLNNDDSDPEGEEDEIPGAGKILEEEIEAADGKSRSPSPTAYLPHIHGATLAQDEELVADPTTYKMLHTLSMAWPALSFDVLRDDLGEQRSRMPHSACIVAGTQAEASGDVGQDEIMVMRWEGLSKMAKDPLLEEEEEDDDDDDDDDVEEEPTLTFRTIPHQGSVNRIKAQPLALPLSNRPPRPPDRYYAASFSGTGKVHIFDLAPHLYALQAPAAAAAQTLSKKPLHSIHNHGRAEGFALSWGPAANQPSSLRLLSGDVHSKIFLTVSAKGGFTTNTVPYTSHTSSVEDLQWSPSEPTVFASCSADRSLRVWDVRVKDRRSVLGVGQAHPTDVNVLSWNQKTSYLIVTGGDEGGIKVWDLRNLPAKSSQPAASQTHQPVATFNWHKGPITSIEWHPTEDSCFAAAGEDDQVTLWDLSVEADEEEQGGRGAEGGAEVPAQLLFAHHGQSQVKEVHWHPQIPGMVISTALDGINVFKTISV